MDRAATRQAIHAFVSIAAGRSGIALSPLVPLSTLLALALLREASWDVNVLLLNEFLCEEGFVIGSDALSAYRILTPEPVVLLLRDYRSNRESTAFLVYAEYRGFRLASVLVDHDVAIVPSGHVVIQSRCARVPERSLGSSLWSKKERTTTDSRADAG